MRMYAAYFLIRSCTAATWYIYSAPLQLWFTGIALKWYCSCVDWRTQTFQVSSQLSSTFIVYCSVPQGSFFRALKFVTYTEDLPALIQRFAIDHHLYIDDTQLSDKPPITSIAASISNMEHCVNAVHTRFQLTPLKSEINAQMSREHKPQFTCRDGYGHAL